MRSSFHPARLTGSLRSHRVHHLLTATTMLALCLTPFSTARSAPEQRTLIDVEMTEGTNMSAALSPDGKTFVIALQGVLWSLPVTGGKATALTPASMDAQEPAWSPDGSTIAFYAFADNGFSVWTMAPDGSGLKQASETTEDARYPSFSPDGDNLLYASDGAGGYNIRSLALDSGEYRQLTFASETGYEMPPAPYFRGAGNAVYPALSPDGDSMAFVIDGSEDTLVVRDKSATDTHRAVFSSATLGAPLWTPGGDVLYIAGLEENAAFLARVPLDGSAATKLVEGMDVFPFRPSLAADGTLYYTADGGIHSITPEGKAGRNVPFSATVTLDRTPYQRRAYDFDNQAPQKALGIIDPVLSPDGSSLAFAALGDLWLAELATGTTRQLTDDKFVDLSPSWSPDGKRIAFISDRGGKTAIWALDVASGETAQLADTEAVPNSPVWSPDGKEIAYLADSMIAIFLGGTVNVLDVASGASRVISEPIFGPSAPAWSPDGSTVAVYHRRPISSRFREGHNVIYLLPASGEGDKLMVSPVPGKSLGRRQFNRPAWSSKGDMVYRIDGQLWSVHLSTDGTTGTPVEIAGAGENPSWSADASHLVYLDGASIKLYDAAKGSTRSLDVQPEWQRALPAGALTIRAGKLYDGTGDSYRENVDIHVKNGVISAVVAAGSAPVEGELIDASQQAVLPGLIEGHTHLTTAQGIGLGETYLSFGITSVRETGTDPYFAVERREAEASGRRNMPRIFTAGPLNEGARVSYGVSDTVGSVERAEDSMRLSDELQLDMYKSYVRQGYTVQKRVIELAHASGIPLSSHELYPAVANGIDQMEHFGATSRRGYSLKTSRLHHAYQDVIALISQSGMVLTPTLALEARGDSVEAQLATLRKLAAAGAKIQAGTDSPFVPHGEALHRELEIYVQAGQSPAWAIRTATSDSARYIGAGDQIGTIAPGYMADILIVDGDPLKDILALREVDTVIKSGAVAWRKSQ
ncbi:amidohydrolase family protein [Haliea sp. E17]|uniref:amidohydrolase family protein n=1 Tax=Haliea sp. E17 TaxID=3401576 RepID=UPI003AACAD67